MYIYNNTDFIYMVISLYAFRFCSTCSFPIKCKGPQFIFNDYAVSYLYNFTQHIISCSNEWHIAKYNYKQSFLHVHNHKTYFTMFNSVIDRKNRAWLNGTVSHCIIVLTKFYDFIIGKPLNCYIYKSSRVIIGSTRVFLLVITR